ncbi:MAG: ankyrin repeat domain-containing protein [Legionella sp.]|jgi:ankyrin repeat protein
MKQKTNTQTNNDSEKIKKIVDQSRKGHLWGLKDILMAVPADQQGPLLNNCDSFGDTALLAAISNGHETVVRYLLTIPGLDLNLANERTQYTPLIMSAAKGYKTIVQLLLSNKSVVTGSTDINKMTAAEEAVYNHHDDIAQLIRSSSTPS